MFCKPLAGDQTPVSDCAPQFPHRYCHESIRSKMEIYIDAKLNFHERLEKCKMILFIKYSFHPSVCHTFINDLREDLSDQKEDLGKGKILVTKGKTFLTGGKTLMMEGKTLVTEGKILENEGKTLKPKRC